jgi:hypothetical protein
MKKTILFTILTLLGISQAMAEELVPLVREGVQWVNEKVIITNGDTIRYYYRYEFKGEDTESNDVGGQSIRLATIFMMSISMQRKTV